jgi:inhibitor of KinA sporulation pathway (predicted exonuclease)
MSIRKDKIIVVDLEATCWQGFDAPDGQVNEIIEIGVCLLDPQTAHVTDKRSIMVKPIESVVSEFCTKLTSITQEMVDTEGIAFDDACQTLEKEYDSRNRLWASWGGFDREFFKKQCRRRKVRYPFSKKHSNLKRVFQDNYGKRMGLARAMEAMELEQIGHMHRGDDDAYNTAVLLRRLIELYGIHIMKRYGW